MTRGGGETAGRDARAVAAADEEFPAGGCYGAFLREAAAEHPARVPEAKAQWRL